MYVTPLKNALSRVRKRNECNSSISFQISGREYKSVITIHLGVVLSDSTTPSTLNLNIKWFRYNAFLVEESFPSISIDKYEIL